MMIETPRVAIISDLHLGVHTNSTTWHSIAIDWAHWFREQLEKQNIRDIIFCGDWHHNRSEISVNTLQTSADIIDIFKDFNLIMITGNHDMYFKNRTDVHSLSIFRNRQNTTIVDDITTIEAYGRKIVMCPWNCDISKIDICDIIFGHFEIESFAMNSYKICEDGLRIKDLADKTNLVITGHFHTRNHKSFGNLNILYTGNPFHMDFGDANNSKGYFILDLENMNISFHENTISPQYKKISLSDLTKAGKITDDLKKEIKGNFIKFDVDKNISQEHLDFIVPRLTAIGPREFSINYNTSFNTLKSETDHISDFSGIDIEQAIVEFVNMLDIDNKKDIIDYTLELYHKCSI